MKVVDLIYLAAMNSRQTYAVNNVMLQVFGLSEIYPLLLLLGGPWKSISNCFSSSLEQTEWSSSPPPFESFIKY